MQFEKGYIYHIYNQGNNRQKIFFHHRNYEFFQAKIKTHIKPHADILAYCLMPNHFHLMVLVRGLELNLGASQRPAETLRTFNESIGIMLMGYTKAINKQEGRTGKLFREKTKAECVNCPNGVAPSFIAKDGVTEIIRSMPELQYPQVCFNYIHLNPVKAGLVKKAEDWEFSSARFYSGIRNDGLVNKETTSKYIDLDFV